MASKKLSMQLAAQLYTLRDHCQTATDFARTMKKVKKIGYQNVQISGLGPIPALEVRSILDANGLRAIGAHIGLDAFRADLADVFDRCHVYGCEYVAIPYIHWEDANSAAAWKKLAKEFTVYAKAGKAEGIVVQYHNHAFEMARFKYGKGMATGLQILYRESDAKLLQAEIDTHWVARGGGDPAAYIRSLKGRSDQVHFKDMVIHDNQPVMAEIGYGNLDWNAILDACVAAKVKDVIVEQDICPITKDPFKSLKMSYEFLKTKGLA